MWYEEVLSFPVLSDSGSGGAHPILLGRLDPSRSGENGKNKATSGQNKQRDRGTFCIKYVTSLNSQHSNLLGQGTAE